MTLDMMVDAMTFRPGGLTWATLDMTDDTTTC